MIGAADAGPSPRTRELYAFYLRTFALAYGEPLPAAVYDGVFHAVSAFNNAGFSINADSLMAGRP